MSETPNPHYPSLLRMYNEQEGAYKVVLASREELRKRVDDLEAQLAVQHQQGCYPRCDRGQYLREQLAAKSAECEELRNTLRAIEPLRDSVSWDAMKAERDAAMLAQAIAVESCAKVCDAKIKEWEDSVAEGAEVHGYETQVLEECAAAIRSLAPADWLAKAREQLAEAIAEDRKDIAASIYCLRLMAGEPDAEDLGVDGWLEKAENEIRARSNAPVHRRAAGTSDATGS